MTSLETYQATFSTLSLWKSQGKIAPHKPLLLLALLDSVSESAPQNRFPLDAPLIKAFETLWRLAAASGQPRIEYPFYHLSTDRNLDRRNGLFWHLQTKQGHTLHSILTASRSPKSLRALQSVVDYGYFSDDLFRLIRDTDKRKVLRDTVLAAYSIATGLTPTKFPFFPALPTEFKKVRSAMFRPLVLDAYNYTCAVSGLHLKTDSDITILEAAHIDMFSESENDFITNGLTLAPNQHTAFDKGLWCVEDGYRIRVSPSVKESPAHHAGGLWKYHGATLHLPKDDTLKPLPEHFAKHRDKWKENFQ